MSTAIPGGYSYEPHQSLRSWWGLMVIFPMKHVPLFATFLLCAGAAAADPCKSGLAPNQRPGPYSALVCVGPQRGQQHCYICEAGDRPLVIVFARSLSEPLGKLAKQLDNAVKEHSKVELRSWVTFLADDQTSMDP